MKYGNYHDFLVVPHVLFRKKSYQFCISVLVLIWWAVYVSDLTLVKVST